MITYSFSATEFTFTGLGTVGNGNGAQVPQDPVTGSVTLDGATVLDIDLTIAGHAYALPEVSALIEPGVVVVGASNNGGADRLASGTNDFQLFFGVDALGQPAGSTFVFDYATDVFDVTCQCTDIFSSITGRVTTVPEPSLLPLLLLAAALAFTAARGTR